MDQPIRVLVAKPGLDGHDRGILVVAQGLRDAGMEVIYTGLRQTPEQIVAAAIQEDVACVGLSSLSGAHLTLFPEVARLLREEGADDVLLIGGGVIPAQDVDFLKQAGFAAIFTPGSSIEDMAEFIRGHVKSRLSLTPPLAECVVRLDHIGMAVNDVEAAIHMYCEGFGFKLTEREEVPSERLHIAFVSHQGACIELLQPTDDQGPVAKFLDQRGPGLHHVAYEVVDVKAALEASKDRGMRLVDEVPRRGSRNKWVGFVHPKSTQGVLTEFCAPMAQRNEDLGTP